MKKIFVLTATLVAFGGLSFAADTCNCQAEDLVCKNECAKNTVTSVKNQVKQDSATAKQNVKNAQKNWANKTASAQKEGAYKGSLLKGNWKNHKNQLKQEYYEQQTFLFVSYRQEDCRCVWRLGRILQH